MTNAYAKEDEQHRQRMNILIREQDEVNGGVMSALVYRKLVMPGDLNPAGHLFGGSMMKWIDEAAAIYGRMLLGADVPFVTMKVSEVMFRHPAPLDSLLNFYANISRVGRSSFEVGVSVCREDQEIVTCFVTFVTVGPDGHSTPHKLEEKWASSLQ